MTYPGFDYLKSFFRVEIYGGMWASLWDCKSYTNVFGLGPASWRSRPEDTPLNFLNECFAFSVIQKKFLKKENKKHVTQQASLVGAMKETGLLSGSHFYMEFGCGKAELSRMVNACVVHDTMEQFPNKQNLTKHAFS